MIVFIALLLLLGIAFVVSAVTGTPPLQVIQNWIRNGR